MKRLIVVLIIFSGKLAAQRTEITYPAMIQPAVFSLTMVMMHDVVNPPAASRYYNYCTLGAYEIVSQHDTAIKKPGAFLRNYTPAIITTSKKDYDYQLAALYCIYETGRLMLPSGYMLEEKQQQLLTNLKKKKIKQSVLDSSVAVARQVAVKMVEYSRKDNYSKLSSLLRYTPVKGEAYWFPTPPAYIEAVEPHWNIVKPMLVDSSNQFLSDLPTDYSKDSGSGFYKLAKEVYDISKTASPEQIEMAGFWDCNPFAVSNAGHMSIGFKKISPGGHWMNITSIAAEKVKLGFNKSVLLHALTAQTLMDAFICCWDEKYRSNRVRPETFINRYIDIKWQPFLQTPPFPEYTSGHSVISGAAAELLTYLLGENFAYTDDTEVMFELAPRHFNSFKQAAAEAALSRLYGGIHYRDAIEEGVEEGAAIGNFIVEKIRMQGIRPLL